jgi:hypothetical protein
MPPHPEGTSGKPLDLVYFVFLKNLKKNKNNTKMVFIFFKYITIFAPQKE